LDRRLLVIGLSIALLSALSGSASHGAIAHVPARAPTFIPPIDAVSVGFGAGLERSVPLFSAIGALPGGDFVVFDGLSIVRYGADGFPEVVLGTLPSFVYADFVVADPSATFAVVGESSQGVLYRVDLTGAGMSRAAQLMNNFDAVFDGASHLIVSSSPCFANCGTNLTRIDLTSGAETQIGHLPGASGPLARSAHGDLYYAVQASTLPPPPGSIAILRWSASTVASGAFLTPANAATFATGFDGGASLACDPVHGHVFIAESRSAGISDVIELDGNGARVGAVVTSPDWIEPIAFSSVPGAGAFEAFQPSGLLLRYQATDFVQGTSRVGAVQPERPTAKTSGPGLAGPGLVRLAVQGALPSSQLLIAIAPSSSCAAQEAIYDVGTCLLHSCLPLALLQGATVIVPTDVNGAGQYTLFNSGAPHSIALQAIVESPQGAWLGSAPTVFN
jgi:hypothetical protein